MAESKGNRVETELAFSTTDLALTRFAVSPMWQVVTSFRLLTSGSASPVHAAWIERVRPRLAASGLTSGWLAELVPATQYLVDFLTPLPVDLAPTLDEELAAIRATPARLVVSDLDTLGRTSDRIRALRSNPAARLVRVAEEIEAYWGMALAPYWARICALLETDVFRRIRQVAEKGSVHLLNDLHTTLRWDDNTLRLVRRHCGPLLAATGPGLVLVPSAFATQVLTWSRPEVAPQISYPARGVGTLWEHRPLPRAEAVAAVIGRSRTVLLAELETPASTTDLARRTGMSAAAVSQHLTTLRAAGMVSAHRTGRSVLYARTPVAESLLIASDDERVDR